MHAVALTFNDWSHLEASQQKLCRPIRTSVQLDLSSTFSITSFMSKMRSLPIGQIRRGAGYYFMSSGSNSSNFSRIFSTLSKIDTCKVWVFLCPCNVFTLTEIVELIRRRWYRKHNDCIKRKIKMNRIKRLGVDGETDSCGCQMNFKQQRIILCFARSSIYWWVEFLVFFIAVELTWM